MNARDIRVIQRSQHACFALEPRDTLGVAAEGVRKQLDRDAAAQLGIGGLVDVTHPAGADVLGDFVMRESRADHAASHLNRA
jgi:hypothetical protein